MNKLVFISAVIILYSCTSNDKTDLIEPDFQNDNTSKYQTTTVNDNLQPYVDSLIEFDAIFDEAVGYAGSKPTVYVWFEKLMELGEDKELILLTKHSSPTVRGYSFWALVEREHPKVKEIMLQHVDDSVYIDRMSGCIGYHEKLNDFLFSIIAPNCIDSDCSRLPPEDIAEIKAKMK
ncbi:MAG: hypothetical protein ACFHU9_05770 [Fluviicola sp.]